MTHSMVTIQISPESQLSTPSWMGEVAAFAHILEHEGLLKTIQEQVRFAHASPSVRLIGCVDSMCLPPVSVGLGGTLAAHVLAGRQATLPRGFAGGCARNTGSFDYERLAGAVEAVVYRVGVRLLRVRLAHSESGSFLTYFLAA